MRRRKHKPLISLLVPFRGGDPSRERIWAWLREYWHTELPEAEIVMGEDWTINGFSKTCAINDAASKARGRIFVVLDADAYVTADIIRDAAARILRAELHGHRLWVIPYRSFYRLNAAATERVLTSPPCNPYRYPEHPDPSDVEGQNGSGSMHDAHYYGALIQVMPREAFFFVGGFDPRFRGWSGDDVSMLRALDTLWAKHKTLRHSVLHLHHVSIGTTWRDKAWSGQVPGSKDSQRLASRYGAATGDRVWMRKIVDEGLRVPCKTSWFHKMLYFTHWRNWRHRRAATESAFDRGANQVKKRKKQ